MDYDLSECEREPIHQIGNIQPHGFLLGLDHDLVVKHCSGNVEAFLCMKPDTLIGSSLSELISPATCRQIKDALVADELKRICPLTITLNDETFGPFEASFYRSDELLILEAERVSDCSAKNIAWELSSTFASLFKASRTSDLLLITARIVHEITDFDRVLIYQFDDEWNGCVVAEERRDFMHSYMNQRFPASDIPSQARELYRRNPIRLLVDVNAVPSPVLPALNQATGQPLDLSFSMLRSMSPVHIEYLKNMDVTASMSISVIKDGNLWALIACHHKQPKLVGYDTRSICQLLAQVLSMQVSRMEHAQLLEHTLSLKTAQEKLLHDLSSKGDLADGLIGAGAKLLESMAATGFALFFEETISTSGITPELPALEELHRWLNHSEQTVVLTHKLSQIYPPAKSFAHVASGILAVQIAVGSEYWLVWFRPEIIQELAWAGNPHKSAYVAAEDGRIHPRLSFELWKEQVRETAAPWLQFEINFALELRTNILDFVFGQFIKRRRAEDELHKQREQFHLERKQLKDLSLRDQLTGLFNRRYMEEFFARELARSRRKSTPLSVLMIDLDHFKKINDTFGHKAGDVILRELGGFLKNQLRATDIICRYGGEEFVVILPESSIESARRRAEQLREGVKNLNTKYGAEPLPQINISVGVAAFQDNGESIDEIICAADAALYQAKNLGRDRTCVAARTNAS
jgi:diguanylate cyclase (GGDEF)-like protein